MKLSQFAKEQGMAYITVYKHWSAGNIEGIQLPGGTILVSGWKDQTEVQTEKELAIVYSRVSTNNQKIRLKNQTADLTNFALDRGYDVIDTVEEVGAAFSDRRTKFLSILHRTDWNVLIVEDVDNLMKFGFPYLEVLLRASGREVIALNQSVTEDQEVSDEAIENSGEQELIGLVNKIRAITKPLLGMGHQKNSLEKSINALYK
jgi:predicted site-specific integrase-resolvase